MLGLCTFIASIRSCNGLVMFVYVGGNAKFFCAFDGLVWNFMDEWMARAGARQVRLQRWISEVVLALQRMQVIARAPCAADQLAGGNRRGTKSAPALAHFADSAHKSSSV